jgi:hypothetical protein
MLSNRSKEVAVGDMSQLCRIAGRKWPGDPHVLLPVKYDRVSAYRPYSLPFKSVLGRKGWSCHSYTNVAQTLSKAILVQQLAILVS